MQHSHFKELTVVGILFFLFWASMTSAMLPEMMSDSHGSLGRDSPSVVSWILNMDTRDLTLTFNETMDVSSLDVTGITIQDGQTASVSYPLLDSTSASPNGTTVTIDISTHDFNMIADTPHLAKSLDSSYLTIAPTAIRNMTGATIAPILDGSALQASTYTADAIAPTLTLVHISSNYTDATLAKVGTNVTVSCLADEPLNATEIFINAHAAALHHNGLFWNASYIMQQTDSDGVVVFAITFSDIANNPGAQITSVTDASSVTFDKTPPTSAVDSISPFWTTVSPLTINVSASDLFSGVKNVTLYFRYSTNNVSWDSSWVSAGVDTASPWSWSFAFPNGTRYYQFTSTANDNVTNAETGPSAAETRCGFDIVVPPSGLIATVVSTTQINLAWTKGIDTNRTRIQRKTGGYPQNISDGTNVYNGSNASCSDSGLSPGTLYYYRAWSFNATGSLWSTTNASASGTTQSDSGVPPGPGPEQSDTSTPVSKPGGPYHGAVDTMIHFDGSASYDVDTSIARFDWRFSLTDTWYNNSGPIPTHIYDSAGTFTVMLRVFDAAGNTATNTTLAIISIEAVNQPPTTPRVSGPTIGAKNTAYTFNIVSSDSDGDSIRYHVQWGDGTTNTSSLHDSSSICTMTHTWAITNVYRIAVYAEDQNNATSESAFITIAIDSKAVQGYGYCFDYDEDGSPDSFYWNSTGQVTPMERQSNGTYLLDFNGDATMDHWYDPVTNTISAYSPLIPSPPHQEIGNPWVYLAAIAVAVVIIGLIVWLYKTGRI